MVSQGRLSWEPLTSVNPRSDAVRLEAQAESPVLYDGGWCGAKGHRRNSGERSSQPRLGVAGRQPTGRALSGGTLEGTRNTCVFFRECWGIVQDPLSEEGTGRVSPGERREAKCHSDLLSQAVWMPVVNIA